ncbi:hypothetical protein [Sulfuriroseicoccus oceanibius]|uniref:Lipoprotein n=1 Tax=Sulfuriroseicoccus oceanibius TaxID=2707525 RepID=A0A6B3LAG9_9BACT|nr:hypothetical protein [Sulfuriroseicoccus oceanibius]QQL45231.1 hypothetical protein G3M56_001185 [Sulfuriroseicoccus oceanibius]
MRKFSISHLLTAGALVLTACSLTSCKVMQSADVKQKNEALERYSLIYDLEEQGINEADLPPEDRDLTDEERAAAHKIRQMREQERRAAQETAKPRYLTRAIYVKKPEPSEVAVSTDKQEPAAAQPIENATAQPVTKPAAKPKRTQTAGAKPKQEKPKVAVAQPKPAADEAPADEPDPQPQEVVQSERVVLPAGEDAEVLVDIPGLIPVDNEKKPFAKDPVDEVGLYPEY